MTLCQIFHWSWSSFLLSLFRVAWGVWSLSQLMSSHVSWQLSIWSEGRWCKHFKHAMVVGCVSENADLLGGPSLVSSNWNRENVQRASVLWEKIPCCQTCYNEAWLFDTVLNLFFFLQDAARGNWGYILIMDPDFYPWFRLLAVV